MPKNRETDPGPDDSVSEPNGPGEGPMGPGWIVLVALYLVVVSVLVLYGLIKLWPYPTPSGESNTETEAQVETPRPTTNGAGATSTPNATAAPATETGPNAGDESGTGAAAGTAAPTSPKAASSSPPKKELPDPETIYFFRGRLEAKIYLETRLLLLVMLAGALGSLMHALRSLYWYTGNRMMVWSWVGFYMLLPVTGAMLAVIFYFVVRGGFFSPQASFENTSPFGFAALSALVGLFSPQATLKLKEIAETIFTKPGAGTDTKPQATEADSSDATGVVSTPTISSINPPSARAATRVVVTGSGFVTGAAITFGGLPAQVISTSDTMIEALIPTPAPVSGPVDVEVTNADGGKATLSEGFIFVAAGEAPGEEQNGT